jgi:hypothetical protein
MPHTYARRGAARPPHRTWIELSATIDFMLATLVGNGAAWSRGRLGELVAWALGQMSQLATQLMPHGSAACARRVGSRARTCLSNIVVPQIESLQ